jgi:amidase
VAGLASATLRGARLGLVSGLMGKHVKVTALARAVLEQLRAAGAVVVEVELHPQRYEDAELEVLLYECKADLDAYLAARGGPIHDLAAVVAFNTAHAAEELGLFGQELFEQAAARGPLTSPAYRKALATCRAARVDLEAAMRQHGLDALVGPTGTPAWPIDPLNGDAFGFSASTAPAVAGWPHLTVPMGFIGPLPVGFSFIGRPWTDGKLLALGHAFEQLTRARRAPRYLTTV